jgi:hypothetical protein
MTATTTIQYTSRAAAPGPRRLRAIAVGAAVVTTGTLYVAARALGTDFALTDPGKSQTHQLILPEIVVFTLVFSLLGWAAITLLERYVRRARGIWTALAGAVLLLSFVPIALEQATADTKLMLVLIHAAVAAVLVPAFRLARR